MALTPPSSLGIASNVPLARMTTLGIGGDAELFVAASDPLRLVEATRWARDKAVPLTILGGGSNVVIADQGVAGLVLQPADNSVQWHVDGDEVAVQLGAGATWDDAVRLAVDKGWAGIECLSGIPGLCGAAPMQNIGAYGQQLSDVFDHALVLDVATMQTQRWDRQRCAFAYRDSALKRRKPGSIVVLQIALRLRVDGRPTLRYGGLREQLGPDADLADTRREVLRVRASKGMVVKREDPDSRSAGSFFVNPIVTATQANEARNRLGRSGMPSWDVADGVKLSAAWLIDNSGMHKGYGEGRVGLSSKHTLALINRGGATATELLAFAAHVREQVLRASGISLHREPRLLGFSADPAAP